MPENKLVLVAGGAGYIGSHTVLALNREGYDFVIADNFCNSNPMVIDRLEELTGRKITLEKINLCDYNATKTMFERYDFGSVIHFAGLKAVGESVGIPLAYYRNNLISTLNILDCMKEYGVKNLVFSSSATVYGDPTTVPITEDFPLSATNPYGRTKLMIEDILRDLYKSDSSFNIALLRYFNPIGADRSGRIGEEPFGIPNNLLPYLTQIAVGRRNHLNVFGNDYDTPDGTGVRDYIHVCDLADGHVAALFKLATGCGMVTVNLGTGKGHSVLEVVTAFEKASGIKIPYVITDRRPGDIATSYADPSLAKEILGWSAKRDIEEMCADSWHWQSSNPNGYSE